MREHIIIARATPEHKLGLIDALRADGYTIAMTGDGFNDAPALNRADVGVAMGVTGTDAAKEAGEIVLTDDNFASIVHAVQEGRTVYDNIRKAILYILPTSFGEAGAIILAVLLGQTLPITALQILWVNLVTEVTLSVSIAFDRPVPGIMQRPPRSRDTPLLSWFLIWRIGLVALLMTLGSYALFLWRQGGGSLEEAARLWSTALSCSRLPICSTAATCTPLRSAGAYSSRTESRSSPSQPSSCCSLRSPISGSMKALFGSAPLDITAWGLAALLALALFLVVEVEKWIGQRW